MDGALHEGNDVWMRGSMGSASVVGGQQDRGERTGASGEQG